ncbi:hypothetical protein EYF80_003601 [Liparis tanakae]|uniref:Uncharacterized protein n=1 Tax=Liparis tanakae TaxID=230148 RepID=A0A4Z2J8P1_9TELE|nr:hypothetical protein EYF80_003601 [Liparis tanakae]
MIGSEVPGRTRSVDHPTSCRCGFPPALIACSALISFTCPSRSERHHERLRHFIPTRARSVRLICGRHAGRAYGRHASPGVTPGGWRPSSEGLGSPEKRAVPDDSCRLPSHAPLIPHDCPVRPADAASGFQPSPQRSPSKGVLQSSVTCSMYRGTVSAGINVSTSLRRAARLGDARRNDGGEFRLHGTRPATLGPARRCQRRVGGGSIRTASPPLICSDNEADGLL